MAKSILITEANRTMLEQEYSVEEGTYLEFVGLWLTTDFGSDAVTIGFLSKGVLDKLYVDVQNPTMQRGYIEVMPID